MLELVLRLGISLAVVLGLFWVVARTGSRHLGGPRALMRVRARQSLTRTASVAVVEVGDRLLVVGVGDGGVRLLTELDPATLEVAAPEAEATVTSAAAALRGWRPTWLAARNDGNPATEEAPAASPSPSTPTVAPAAGALRGSVLSAQTWKQAWDAATAGRSAQTRPAANPGAGAVTTSRVPVAAVVFSSRPRSAGGLDG